MGLGDNEMKPLNVLTGHRSTAILQPGTIYTYPGDLRQCLERVEARDTAKCPTMPRTAPTTKERFQT